MSDEPTEPKITRRRALKRAAAAGAAVWVAPAIQSVNMTRAWAAVGSDPRDPQLCFSVDIDIDPYGAVSYDHDAPFRCLSPQQSWTGASIMDAVFDGAGGCIVTVHAPGARIVEGYAKGRDSEEDARCNPGTSTVVNGMAFAPTIRPTGKPSRVRDVELTFCVRDPAASPPP